MAGTGFNTLKKLLVGYVCFRFIPGILYVKLGCKREDCFFLRFKGIRDVKNDIGIKGTVLHKMKHMRRTPPLLWLSLFVIRFDFRQSAIENSIQSQLRSTSMIGMAIGGCSYQTYMWAIFPNFLNDRFLIFTCTFELGVRQA